MRQVLLGGYYNELHTSNTEYNRPDGGYNWGSELYNRQLLPTSGKVSGLRVRLFDSSGNPAAPGAGKSWTFTFRKNGTGTDLTCTISDAETSGEDTTHEVSVATWNPISIEAAPSGTPASGRYALWSLLFEGDIASECVPLGPYQVYDLSLPTRYNRVKHGWSWGLEGGAMALIPTAGKIKKLAVRLTVAPVQTLIFTLRHGASLETIADTDLVVTLSGAETSGQDTTHEVSVAAGEYISLKVTESGSATRDDAGWSCVFEPDNAGEFPIFAWSGGLLGAVTNYNYVNVQGLLWTTSENQVRILTGACTLKGLYIHIPSCAGAGKCRTFTLMKNGVATDLSVQICDGDRHGSDTTHQVTVSDGDYLSLRHVPSDTPDDSDAYWGLTGVIGWAGIICDVSSPANVNDVDAAKIASINDVP